MFTSPWPGGPFVEQNQPTLVHTGPSTGGFVNGDMDLFVDADGTAYLAYTDILGGHRLTIERLNPEYTSGTGASVTGIAAPAESPSLFRRGQAYYLVYGTPCPYCASNTLVRTAASPLGPWSEPATLSQTSCGGQASFVADLGERFLYGSDLWRDGAPNQYAANYFWTPLEFEGSTIRPISCEPTWVLSPAG